ncbi:hypothetical protein, partial [Paraglaciecola sp.]|uniref:hypothetical protein n=1 Tax=Paraglaciecola sp. TaxID=1920173 RepID=UPI0030F3C602
GGIRTPSHRFWRPLFYHWNYTPAEALNYTDGMLKVKRFYSSNPFLGVNRCFFAQHIVMYSS